MGLDQAESSLYLVSKGQARFDGEMLVIGQGWGYDLILESERLRRPSLALAISYLDVGTLGRTKLFQLAAAFPPVLAHLRKCAVRLALCRKMVLEASLHKARLRALAEDSEACGAPIGGTDPRMGGAAGAAAVAVVPSITMMSDESNPRQSGNAWIASTSTGGWGAGRVGAEGRRQTGC